MRLHLRTTGLSLTLIAAALPLAAQNLMQSPKDLVREAARNELNANASDHSHWRYRDDQRDTHTVSLVVETPTGAVKRPILRDGHALTPAESTAAEQDVQSFLHDPAAQRKQKREAEQDDKHANEFLELLPRAFLWSFSSSTAETITLDFQPDPGFHPPDMESRVLCAMSGEIVVDKSQHRIRSIRGHLTQDVNFGWGILGRMERGGNFDVERRQVAPARWQIVSTSVHIHGRALLFKSIAEQQDEVKSEFQQVPESTTLEQAAAMIQTMAAKDQAISTRASR